jgi:phosphoesterase RecJ-like protein
MSDRQELTRAFTQQLINAKSVLIGTHLNPDGDALGSALALSFYLDQIGLPNEVLCHHAPPRNLLFLPGVDRIRQTPEMERHDLGILLDLDSTERLGNTAPFFARCAQIVVIDHHVPHESPGDLRIVDTSAPATAVILGRLLEDLKADITPDIATCLLTGVVTDTGSFRFRNTTPEALSRAAGFLENGGNITLVSEEVFQRKPMAAVRLLGHMLEAMKLTCHERIAWSVLTYEDFERTQARDEDTEGFVNELLFIDSVQIAGILREVKPGVVRCSLRSRGDLDVAQVARSFGGGGHRNAAGCTIDMPPEQAEEVLVRRLRDCLESC